MIILKNLAIGMGLAFSAITILMGAFLTATREQLVIVEAEELVIETDNRACLTPANWYPYILQSDDNVSALAASVGVSESAILTANCVESNLEEGTLIYLPALPESAGLTNCGPPSNWGMYEVQPDETLEQLSARFGTSAWRLRTANCLVDAALLRQGLKIYAPISSTAAPTIEALIAPSATSEPAPEPTLSPTP